MIYSREAKKLGVVVKDSDGKYLEGYILKNVSDIEGKYDLSLAKKFGEGNSLGNIIKIKNVGNKSAEVYLETNAKALALTINSELTTELSENPGCYWVCDGAPVFDWWTCFKCCLMPLSGCS